MRHLIRAMGYSAAAMAAATLITLPAFAQAPANTAAAAKVATSEKAWTPPHNPDGTPDLQGVWSNATTVPLEKPSAGARRGGFGVARGGNGLAVHYDNSQFGLDRSHEVFAKDTRTSLVTTPDGRIPAKTQEANDRIAATAAYRRVHQWDGPEDRPLAERCILWPNEGPPMLSPGYNSDVQIVQGNGYVAILQEMIHDVRLIPTDNRPHLPSDVHQWMGNSVGHWEGNTLVVDTTNFTDKTAFQGSSDHLHVVERFTRTSDKTLKYEFTVDDPHTWAAPWSAETTWEQTDGPIYEYACQEGNYGMRNNLSGERATEKKAAEQAAQKQSN